MPVSIKAGPIFIRVWHRVRLGSVTVSLPPLDFVASICLEGKIALAIGYRWLATHMWRCREAGRPLGDYMHRVESYGYTMWLELAWAPSSCWGGTIHHSVNKTVSPWSFVNSFWNILAQLRQFHVQGCQWFDQVPINRCWPFHYGSQHVSMLNCLVTFKRGSCLKTWLAGNEATLSGNTQFDLLFFLHSSHEQRHWQQTTTKMFTGTQQTRWNAAVHRDLGLSDACGRKKKKYLWYFVCGGEVCFPCGALLILSPFEINVPKQYSRPRLMLSIWTVWVQTCQNQRKRFCCDFFLF